MAARQGGDYNQNHILFARLRHNPIGSWDYTGIKRQPRRFPANERPPTKPTAANPVATRSQQKRKKTKGLPGPRTQPSEPFSIAEIQSSQPQVPQTHWQMLMEKEYLMRTLKQNAIQFPDPALLFLGLESRTRPRPCSRLSTKRRALESRLAVRLSLLRVRFSLLLFATQF